MNPLPVLVQNARGLALVEVDGQAVITAKNLAEGLEYKSEKAVLMIVNRNRASFKDGGVYDLSRGGQSDHSCRGSQSITPCDTLVVRLLTHGRLPPDGMGGGGLHLTASEGVRQPFAQRPHNRGFTISNIQCKHNVRRVSETMTQTADQLRYMV